MNQVLFRVWESMDLLSNRVWYLFLSRIDGEINGEVWELKVTNGGEREKSTFQLLHELNSWGSKKNVGGETERYKYLPVPNGHLSHGSASL